jgi:hypothetical protein
MAKRRTSLRVFMVRLLRKGDELETAARGVHALRLVLGEVDDGAARVRDAAEDELAVSDEVLHWWLMT